MAKDYKIGGTSFTTHHSKPSETPESTQWMVPAIDGLRASMKQLVEMDSTHNFGGKLMFGKVAELFATLIINTNGTHEHDSLDGALELHSEFLRLLGKMVLHGVSVFWLEKHDPEKLKEFEENINVH